LILDTDIVIEMSKAELVRDFNKFIKKKTTRNLLPLVKITSIRKTVRNFRSIEFDDYESYFESLDIFLCTLYSDHMFLPRPFWLTHRKNFLKLLIIHFVLNCKRGEDSDDSDDEEEEDIKTDVVYKPLNPFYLEMYDYAQKYEVFNTSARRRHVILCEHHRPLQKIIEKYWKPSE